MTKTDPARGSRAAPELPLPLVCVSGLLALICGMVVLRAEYGPRRARPPSDHADVPGLLTSVAAARPETHWLEAPELGETLDALWRGAEPEQVPEELLLPVQPVYVALRVDGRRVAEHWGTQGPSRLHALREALDAVRGGAAGADGLRADGWRADGLRADGRSADGRSADGFVLEIAVTRSYRGHRWPAGQKLLHSRAVQGIVGLELSWRDHLERHSPTSIVATNASHEGLLRSFLARHRIDGSQLGDLTVKTFGADQILHFLGPESRTIPMERGNRLVPIDAVTRESVTTTAALATSWLFDNLGDGGRMTYRFRPSALVETPGNNTVRQWMATVAMGRAARRDEDAAAWERVARNIDYNLRLFYREDDGHGLILYGGKVKLGAVALAALAIFEHPHRERWREQEAALQRTVRHLWNDVGSFTTFYVPEGRSDQQNFYPGEALLYWAFLYAETRDPELIARIQKSFAYYRDWHLRPENRNPAFVPWHTQAYVAVWDVTRDEAMKSFVFEMNDWLVDTMLEWNPESELPDLQGRYYNPTLPYGIPHASSTGVYLEGLIDAFRVARAVGDGARAERYRLAILRGLRSTMQLQFVDDVDMFYVPSSKRSRVLGGIRTDVHNSDIRCDNVQHNLMGIFKILDTFGIDDYRHP